MNKRTNLIIKVGVLCLSIIIAIIIIAYVVQKDKYKNKFYNDTVINNVICSGLTIEQAEQKILDSLSRYNLTICFKNSESYDISGSQIDLSVNDINERLKQIKKEQTKQFLLTGKKHKIEGIGFNEKKLKKIVSKIKYLKFDYTSNLSRIVFDEDSKTFQRKVKNFYLDKDDVYKKVEEAIYSDEKKVSVEDLYKELSNDKDLEELQNIAKSEVTYTLSDGEEFTLDFNTFKSWLVQEDDGSFHKDEEVWRQKIQEYVKNELSPKANTYGKSLTFTPTDLKKSVTVNGGNYGSILNQEEEIKALQEDIMSGKTITREPNYTQKGTISSGDSKSYIEIDITRQTVWFYLNDKLIVQTPCVTGCVRNGNGTPTGVYVLNFKQKDAVLKGRNESGQITYQSHVNYWMPFNGGIGLHDALWRSSFGGNIYQNSGSHGCVNLPLEAAKSIYENINKDIPIIVYKS